MVWKLRNTPKPSDLSAQLLFSSTTLSLRNTATGTTRSEARGGASTRQHPRASHSFGINLGFSSEYLTYPAAETRGKKACGECPAGQIYPKSITSIRHLWWCCAMRRALKTLRKLAETLQSEKRDFILLFKTYILNSKTKKQKTVIDKVTSVKRHEIRQQKQRTVRDTCSVAVLCAEYN